MLTDNHTNARVFMIGRTQQAAPVSSAKPARPRPKGFKRFMRIVLKITLWMFALSVFFTIVFRFINPPVTPLMLIRVLEGAVEGRSVGMSRDWVSLDEINPVVLRSVIAAEDARYFEHNGVDWDAIDEAQKYNERHEDRLRGASTITMQCARNVFLWQGRNYIRKGLELYFSYMIDFLWGKRRTLEIYLNVIEWGDGVYGIQAAAQKYFGVSAAKLSPRQAALLVSILPNPRRFSPVSPTARISTKAGIISGRATAVDLRPLR